MVTGGGATYTTGRGGGGYGRLSTIRDGHYSGLSAGRFFVEERRESCVASGFHLFHRNEMKGSRVDRSNAGRSATSSRERHGPSGRYFAWRALRCAACRLRCPVVQRGDLSRSVC